ncbi:MAG TPA: hypothetical protein VFH95_08560 [Candidatus Kapabacteria bacterium]|nr:hypothetical protein [Candidatus Kapabacteria bacterium]
MTASDLKQLATEHLDDARALLGAQRFAGAIYLAGYAVECALKFRICDTLGWEEFPLTKEHRALKSHDLNFLLSFTGKLEEIKRKYSIAWQIVEKWNPEMRYNRRSTISAEALDFLINASGFLKVLL